MAANEIKFTDERFRNFQPHPTKRQYFKDTVQPGLRIQITPKGHITFQYQRWSPTYKRVLTRTLGKYGRTGIGINKARDMSARLHSDLIDGVDIEQTARDVREQDTFDDLFQVWLKDAQKRKRTWETDRRRYELYIEKPFGNRQISWFNRDKIRRWHSKLNGADSQREGRKLGVHTANRCLALVSTVFNSQLPDSPNPTSGVVPFKETSRSRFIQPEELGRFFSALEAKETPEYLRDFVYISLFTGARRGNVGSMRWNAISFELKTWTIRPEDSKNKEPMVIPLDDSVVDILEQRWKGASSFYVFPAKRGKTGHLQAPRKSWADLLDRAKITNLTFHDLRRSLGSYMTILGASTTIVGKGLGHKDKKSTAVYERLTVDPVRKSMTGAINYMKAGEDLPKKIVGIGELKKKQS